MSNVKKRTLQRVSASHKDNYSGKSSHNNSFTNKKKQSLVKNVSLSYLRAGETISSGVKPRAVKDSHKKGILSTTTANIFTNSNLNITNKYYDSGCCDSNSKKDNGVILKDNLHMTGDFNLVTSQPEKNPIGANLMVTNRQRRQNTNTDIPSTKSTYTNSNTRKNSLNCSNPSQTNCMNNYEQFSHANPDQAHDKYHNPEFMSDDYENQEDYRNLYDQNGKTDTYRKSSLNGDVINTSNGSRFYKLNYQRNSMASFYSQSN